MARPAKYPQLNELQQPGDAVMFRAHNFVARTARQYAARHGFQIATEAQDEPADVRESLGTLWRVARL